MMEDADILETSQLISIKHGCSDLMCSGSWQCICIGAAGYKKPFSHGAYKEAPKAHLQLPNLFLSLPIERTINIRGYFRISQLFSTTNALPVI